MHSLKALDLQHFVRACNMLYQKGIDSATGNGDQSKIPEADDDAYPGGIYYLGR